MRKRKLRRTFEKVRKRFPTRERVRLRVYRFKRSADCYGLCSYNAKRKRFTIHLDSRLLRHGQGRAIEVLLHEYAHARQWTKRAHGPRWARQYGRLYRWWFDDE